ncbi:MAG: hypothetical protein HYX28_06400 [Candidatus Koribacter versatilis]|uniref:Uncharacterized protein n=1 Tax=Candidatus Korobacter versatilis TaxID=658062 RepID=A0A932A937_9BACT|nr:hypothetical protein [Candidatus Koribacter versatilis]
MITAVAVAQGARLPSPGPTQAKQKRLYLDPEALLQRSSALGDELVPEERGWLYWRLAEVAERNYPQLASSFAKEGLRSAEEAPQGWNRLALQKNLLVALSALHPYAAIARLGKLEPPLATAGGTFPEDVRAHAANAIFAAYFKKAALRALPRITRVAQYLGETGQYPYEAIGGIIHTGLPAPSAASLASAAVEHYRRPSKFQRESKDFVAFLRLAEGKAPTSILREGGRLAIDRLQSDLKSPGHFVAAIRSNTESITVTSEAQIYLADLLPVLQRIDPDYLSSELERDPTNAGLLRVGSQPHHIEAVVIHGEGAVGPQAELRGIERSRMSRIRVIASDDPDEATALADELTTPSLRVAGMARAAGGYSVKNHDKGVSLLSRAAKEWEKLDSGDAKLSAGIEIEKAALALKDSSSFREVFDKLFAIGEELVSEQLDAKPAALLADCDGFEELSQVANVGARFDPAWTYEQISGLRNNPLKAFLLAEMADGLLANPKME